MSDTAWLAATSVATLLAALVAAGCAGDHGDGHAHHDAGGTMETKLAGASTGGTYHVVVTPTPNPPPVAALFDVLSVISLPDGSTPTAVSSVTIDGWMPHHGHGMEGYTPKTTAVAGTIGTFKSTGLFFNMPGQWQFKLTIKGPDGDDTAVLPIHIKAQ